MIRMSIRRPVAVAMAYASVAALGVFAWRNIPIELYPDTQLPRLTVSASWSGASPETVEAFLTSPLESVIQQVRGVENVISDSQEGSASIQVEFEIDTDMDFARLELSERLSSIEEELPQSVGAVQVEQYVPSEFEGQNQALLRYTFTGPYTMEALHLYLEDVVRPELTQIQGVADVRLTGARDRVLEVRVDPARLTALGLTANQVEDAIRGLDLVREAGAIRTGSRELTVTIVNRAGTLDDVRDAVIAHREGEPVLIKDVATVHETFEEARQLNRINGSPSLFFYVYREDRANSVKTADAVKARMEELGELAPYGSHFILDENSDQSEEIRAQLIDLRMRALVSAVVIFVVLLLFLRSFRSAGMIFATIAFSVLIAINLIYFGGLSLNLLTLMGLAMGFGLIVDNSIVVLENVYRRWQGGEQPASAAEEGTKEVVLPILASTATTLIVFVPFVYFQGELRLYYVPLAIVVVLTLLASLFVAFTFIPAVSARLLSAGSRKEFVLPGMMAGRGRAPAVAGAPSGMDASGPDAARVDDSGAARRSGLGPSDRGMTGGAGSGPTASGGPSSGSGDPSSVRRAPIYVRFYEAVVGFNIRHPWLTVGITIGFLGLSFYLFDKHVTRGRLWSGLGGGQQTMVTITISLPRGSNLDRTDQLARFFEEKLEILRSREGTIDEYVTSVSETSARTEVTFPDSLEFTGVPLAVKDQMFAHSLTFTGADVYVRGIGPSFYGGGGSAPNYRIEILGYNYEKVREIAEDLGRRLEYRSRIREVDTNTGGRGYSRDRAVEYVIRVDRDALSRHGLSVADLLNRIRAFTTTEGQAGSLEMAGDDVRLLVKTKDQESLDVFALREALLPGGAGTAGQSIRLGDVVTIEPRQVLNRVHRENQQYHRTIAYEFQGPRKLGDLIRDQMIAATDLPPGYTIEESSGIYWGDEERESIFRVLGIAILLVFMVTAALFESLRQPLCVLLTVPMALIGVFLIFFYAGATFTQEAYIGVIMMGGIVVNNAILLVDHVNRTRRIPGLSFEQAILRGTLERVRPILMTTATTVLGLLPLVLFSETADANIWNALGYALIGGLLSSTVFVLTTTPALYLLFERGKARKREKIETIRAERGRGGAGASGTGGSDTGGKGAGGKGGTSGGPGGPGGGLGPEPAPA